MFLTHVAGFSALAVVYWYTLVRGSVEDSYARSALWWGMPFIGQIILLQAVAVIGLFAWASIVQRPSKPMYEASVGLYALSAFWPVLANEFLRCPTHAHAIAASLPLLGAAACVLFLFHASLRTSERLLLLPMVVLTVVFDAILWSLSALRVSEKKICRQSTECALPSALRSAPPGIRRSVPRLVMHTERLQISRRRKESHLWT